MARAAAFREQLNVFIDKHLSPQAQSAILAGVAKGELHRLISTGQASAIFTKYADGRKNAPEETALHSIFYEFSYMAQAAAFALGYLMTRSPVKSGRFRDSFFLGIDGRMVHANAFNPATMNTDVREIIISNTQPYERKIDVQIAHNHRLNYSVPAMMFADCADAVRGRYGNVISVERKYTINFPGQYVLRTGRDRGSNVQSPALILTRNT